MKSFTEIDLGRLDEHCVEQDGQYRKYANRSARAKFNLAEAKGAMEVAEAEIKMAIRRNPKKFGIDRISEGAIKEAMTLTKTYRRALKKVNKKQYFVDYLTGVLRTLEHRKSMIEQCISLHGQAYFAKPRVPKDADDKIRQSIDLAEKRAIRRKGLKSRNSNRSRDDG